MITRRGSPAVWASMVVTLRQSVKRYARLHDIELYAGFPDKRKNRWDNRE